MCFINKKKQNKTKRKTLSLVDGWGFHTLPFVVCVNFQARGNLLAELAIVCRSVIM